MATKTPLLKLSGRLGQWLGATNVPIEGTGALTKSHGHYLLKAAITASQAKELDKLKRRVPVEEEAENRALALGKAYEEARGQTA